MPFETQSPSVGKTPPEIANVIDEIRKSISQLVVNQDKIATDIAMLARENIKRIEEGQEILKRIGIPGQILTDKEEGNTYRLTDDSDSEEGGKTIKGDSATNFSFIGSPRQNGTIHEVNGHRQRHLNRDVRPPGLNHVSMTVSAQLNESWFTAIIGSILFAIGMCLLFWNEGNAVKVAHSLDEALNNIVVLSNSARLEPEYDGRLVYLSGPLEVLEPLTEPEYGVIVDSIKLKRRVQMFQWVEIREERYDSVDDYYYTTEWKDKLIDSDHFYIRFGHENPREMPIKSQLQIADEVKIGAFIFGRELKKKFSEYMEITSDERPERKDIKMHSGLYYHSEDLWNTKVGDIRIQFSYSGKAGDVYSIVGMLVDGTIKPYVTSHGEEILLQRKHKVTMDQMFHLEHVHNYWRTWKMRGLGWFLLFLAASYMANILKTIILNSNLLHSLIAMESLSLSVSMSISLLVIGFAWVWYRPIVGLCLALASVLPFMYSIFFANPSPQQRDEYRRL